MSTYTTKIFKQPLTKLPEKPFDNKTHMIFANYHSFERELISRVADGFEQNQKGVFKTFWRENVLKILKEG